MDYKIIESESPNDLSATVTGHLYDGWKLYGNLVITISPEDGQWYYTQAVVRDLPVKNNTD